MRTIMFGVTKKGNFQEIVLNQYKDFLVILDSTRYYDSSHPDYNSNLEIPGGIMPLKYNDVVFKIGSSVRSPEEIRAKFSHFFIGWKKNYIIDDFVKTLWPDDTVVDTINGGFINKSFKLLGEDRKRWKQQEAQEQNGGIEEILWLLCRKTINDDLTAGEVAIVNDYITEGAGIFTA